MVRLGSGFDALHNHGVHHGPVVFAVAVPAGEALSLFKRFEDLGPGTATVGIEVRYVKFLYSVVFHESSLQLGSDILRNRPRVLSRDASVGRRTHLCRPVYVAFCSGTAAARTFSARAARASISSPAQTSVPAQISGEKLSDPSRSATPAK